MSVEDGWRARLNLMGQDSLNEMDKWRMQNAQRDEELARQRRAEKHERQQHEQQCVIDQLRAEMHREISGLRDEMYKLHEDANEAAGTVIGDYSNRVRDVMHEAIKELKTEVAQKFGELMGRLDALSGAPSRSQSTKDFRFANERSDDVVDLPNPLVRKVTVN